MNSAELLECCLRQQHANVETPFGDDTLVVKVAGKAFAFIPLDVVRPQISLKAQPEVVLDLQDAYEDATPAPHLNKKHWVRLYCDGLISERLVQECISTSYDLVYAGLTRRVRQQIESQD